MSYAWRASELALRPETAPGLTFAVVRDRPAFDALEPEWNDLFRRAGRDGHLFQTFNWNWHWDNHYLRPPLFREIGLRRTGVEEAPWLDLASAPDFAAYEQRYSAKARKNRRRLMRRLEERGRVTVARHTGGSRARALALESIALKRQSLAATGRLAPAVADLEALSRSFSRLRDAPVSVGW